MKIPHISIPILLVGPPGAGKTASVLDSFDYVEVSLASTLTEEDIAGLPYREGDYDYRTIPSMFRRLHEASAAGKSTALFFDELDKARRSVADTLLTLIASRGVGNATLPKGTHIIAAANPPELGGGDGISDAMISRFSVIEYIPNPVEWATWAKKKYNSSESIHVIRAVECGEFPIFDLAGEGLSRRITSPRTITYALEVIESGCDDRTTIIQGLMTAGSASHFMHLVQQSGMEELSKPVEIARNASRKKSVTPLRIP